jgi:hypothetical protein
MLIQRKPTAVKTLTVRTDLEAYEGIQGLSKCLSSSLSVLLRVAIFDLLEKQKKVEARNLTELMENNHRC